MVERGCGFRAEDSLYICAGGRYGRPLEDFLIDPPIEWKGAYPLRSPMLIQDSAEIYHLVLGIGATYYPFISDYVEEAKVFGVSRKVKRDFDPSNLTRVKSKLLFMHPRGIPEFYYELIDRRCPSGKHPLIAQTCIGNLWSLSTGKHCEKYHELEVINEIDSIGKQIIHYKVSTPSRTYDVVTPESAPPFKDQIYKPALFLQLPIFRFEYVSKKNKVPPKVQERISKAGFRLEVLPE